MFARAIYPYDRVSRRAELLPRMSVAQGCGAWPVSSRALPATGPHRHDRAIRVFACHKSPEGLEFACAGFLERSAEHNLTIRIAYANRELVRMDRSGGLELHENYRAMAIANGVKADDPVLVPCR